MREATRGLLLGSLAAVIWGSTYVTMRLLYRVSDIDPVGLAFSRFLIGALVLTAVTVARGEARHLTAFVREPLPFFWLGLTGVAALGILGAAASELTAAVNVSLVLNANPVFVALLAPLIGEPLTVRRLTGAVIGLAGVAVVALAGTPSGPVSTRGEELWGVLAAVGAALGWAIYTLLGKGVVRRYGGLLTTTLAMGWGTLLLAALMVVTPLPRHLPPTAIGLLLYLGLVPSALAFALWYRALAVVDAATLAPTQYLAPLGTAVLAWLLLGERIGFSFLVALLLVFVGIRLATRP